MKLNKLRRWCRFIHRDLSFLFSGMLIVYAISGIAMNHLKTSSPYFDIEKREYQVDLPNLNDSLITKEYVVDNYLKEIDQVDNYTKHYFPQKNTLKVFLKGGSNLEVDLETNQVVYEELKPRYIVGAFTKLHYNPTKLWTWFADIFAICLIIITITGLLMVKGKHGLIGIGGVELIIGIIVPLLFILL